MLPTSTPQAKRVDFSSVSSSCYKQEQPQQPQRLLPHSWKRERMAGPAGSLSSYPPSIIATTNQDDDDKFTPTSTSTAGCSSFTSPAAPSSSPFFFSSPESSSSSSSAATPKNRSSLLPASVVAPPRLETDFHVLSVLGEGSFGQVLLVQHRLDQHQYAVKQLRRGTKLLLQQKELRAHVHLGWHAHLVNYHTSWMDASSSVLHLQLELCGMTLAQARQQPGVVSAVQVGRHIASALCHLHSKHFAHLDCKPANILLSASSPASLWKLADFGHCTELSPTTGLPLSEVLDGDFTYMSSEFVNDDYDQLPKADVLSLGLCLLELFLAPDQLLPSRGEQWDAVRRGQWPSAAASMPAPLELVVRSMTLLDVDRRMRSLQALDALSRL